MAHAAPPSLRSRCENLVEVRVGTARAQNVVGAFLDRATGEGAKLVGCEAGPFPVQWPDGTSLCVEGLAVPMSGRPAPGQVH